MSAHRPSGSEAPGTLLWMGGRPGRGAGSVGPGEGTPSKSRPTVRAWFTTRVSGEGPPQAPLQAKRHRVPVEPAQASVKVGAGRCDGRLGLAARRRATCERRRSWGRVNMSNLRCHNERC